jgi:hypothetical protein
MWITVMLLLLPRGAYAQTSAPRVDLPAHLDHAAVQSATRLGEQDGRSASARGPCTQPARQFRELEPVMLRELRALLARRSSSRYEAAFTTRFLLTYSRAFAVSRDACLRGQAASAGSGSTTAGELN